MNKTVRISARVTPWQKKLLEEAALDEGRSESNVVERALSAYLSRHTRAEEAK